jgi:hypothetical protein
MTEEEIRASMSHFLGWFLVLLDGWVTHTHYVAALGFVLIGISLIYFEGGIDE